MTDQEIIALLFARDESALSVLNGQYGGYYLTGRFFETAGGRKDGERFKIAKDVLEEYILNQIETYAE